MNAKPILGRKLMGFIAGCAAATAVLADQPGGPQGAQDNKPVETASGPAAHARACAEIEGVSEHRLPNGLRILLMPEPSQPKVHVHCTVLCGTRHEGLGEAGMAHLLEHMLIKGTSKHPDIMRALRDRGAADANAYTSKDSTRFVQSLPATGDNLEFAIALEADRLANSRIRQNELASEMNVVVNEFEINENSPAGLLSERLAHAAFRWHTYSRAVLGNRSEVLRVPAANLEAFYRKHYRPDNAVLVVAGRFDPAQGLALAAKHFGPIPTPAEPLAEAYAQEPPQDGERSVVLRRVGKVGAVTLAYRIPAGSHPDYPAVMTLVEALGHSPSGRLHQTLVKGKKAVSSGAAAPGFHDPWLAYFSATVADAAGLDAAREALIATVEGVAAQPLDAESLARAKRSYALIYEQFQGTAGEMAGQLDFYSGVGDWRLFFWERDAVAALTLDDLRRVAGKYFVRGNRTSGTFIPAKSAERADIPEVRDLAARMDQVKGTRVRTKTEAFDPTPENIAKRLVAGKVAGLKAWYLPKPTADGKVHGALTLRYGSEATLGKHVGAAQLMPSLLTGGTKRRSRQQLVDELDKLKSGLAPSGSLGEVTLRIVADKEHLPAVLALAAEVLREPSFPDEEFATLKARTLAGLAAARAEPGALASNALSRKLKPYAKTDVRYEYDHAEGQEIVAALRAEDFRNMHAEFLGADAGELALVGEFDPKVVEKALGEAFAGWRNKTPYQRIAKPAAATDKGDLVRIATPDKPNALHFAALAMAIADSHPDVPALTLGTYLLGGDTLTSRLGTTVRKQQGLTYGIEASFDADSLDPNAAFVIAASAAPGNIPKVRKLARAELQAMLDQPAGEAEFAAARTAYLEMYKASLADDAGLASRMSVWLSLGLTPAYRTERMAKIAALTPAAVQAAMRKHLDPAKLIVVEAGDFAKK